jgi:hypothetical protein
MRKGALLCLTVGGTRHLSYQSARDEARNLLQHQDAGSYVEFGEPMRHIHFTSPGIDEFVCALFEQFGSSQQDLAAFSRAGDSPTLKSFMRRRYGVFNILL